MGPPMAPGPQGQMPLPQNSPYPPQGVSDSKSSIMCIEDIYVHIVCFIFPSANDLHVNLRVYSFT